MLNNICIMGRMVRDPDQRQTQSGTAVCSYTIACDRMKKAGEQAQADFIDCVAFGKTAEHICKYFQKGSAIIVEGRLQSRSYEDKSGNKRKAVEVIANNVNFAGSKASTPAASGPAEQPQDSTSGTADFTEIADIDDLPF